MPEEEGKSPPQQPTAELNSEPTINPELFKDLPPHPEIDRPWPEPDDPAVHIGRLDLRVGRIIDAYRYPPDYKQYSSVIDFGGVVDEGMASSELLPYYKPEELEGRLVVGLCNVIPLFHRGIACRTQLMCASDITEEQVWADHVQLLSPPPTSIPGDRVIVSGYCTDPDLPFVDPDSIVFETIAKDLRVNSDRHAVYKGVQLQVEGKGFVTAETLKDCLVTFE